MLALQNMRRATQYAAMAGNAVCSSLTKNELVQKKAERHLIQRMGRLRGLPQKLGQMLSFGDVDDSDEAVNAYRELQEDAQPLPLEELTPTLEQAWEVPLDNVLSNINALGKAGSIGQVHRATLHDGREVAIKIQYPGIEQAVMSDLKMLGWLSIPLGGLRRGFDMSGYQQAILEDMQHELDYQQEARAHTVLRQAFRNPAVIIPKVDEPLSTKTVLVTDWIEGDHWDEVCTTWKSEEKRSLANLMQASFLEGLFLGGAMQADWHPGNFRFRRSGGKVELICYDLGSIYRPSDDERLVFARLIQATCTGEESPLPLLIKLGFSAEFLEPMAEKLPALCRVLFEPFCTDRPYHLSEWNLKQRVADILGEDRWNFRIAGPPQLVFLLRAFHGLIYYLQGLDAELFWSRPFSSIAQRLKPQMGELQFESKCVDLPSFESLAKHMQIRVTHNGQPKATITTRATSIENLQDLLDEDLQQRIASRGIHLQDVVAEARRRCYAPGLVFELREDAKHVTVTLE